MYRLKRENVVKVVDSAVKRDSLIRLGFFLLTDEAAPDKTETEDTDTKAEDKPLEAMTVQELKEIAKQRGLDISVLNGKRKQEILDFLEAAESGEGAADTMREDMEAGRDDNGTS